MRSRLWLLLPVLLPLVSVAQPTIRVDVQLVNMGFSVRDAQGRLVPDLSESDFEVSEDGAPQKIAFFARSADVPLNLGLIVDISGSQAAFLKQHHKDLRAFLDLVLTARDRAFLVCFSNRPRLVAAYTSSGKKLVDALEGYENIGYRSDYPILGTLEIPTGGTVFYDAIYHAARQMFQNTEQGRRALIIFSDGEDNASAHHMLDAIEAAQSNDVLLFCIRYTDIRNGRPNSRNKYGTSVMERIAIETGGADFDAGARDLAAHFREIGAQLRSSYELAYHPGAGQNDGTFHKVRISVKRPNLTVRAKTGYYAR
jgi:Ca-activated chloride channel family protein